jgi:hypothetical protein
VPRIAARLAVMTLLLLSAGCGGGGDGNSDADHAGIEAFPDVLEIARAELGENTNLHDVTVTEKEISFVNVQLGRNVRVRYNTSAVFVANDRVRERLNPASTFSIATVSPDAPAKLLAAIQEREDGDVAGFSATLSRDERGELAWRAKATVDGEAKEYEAAPDGTLR